MISFLFEKRIYGSEDLNPPLTVSLQVYLRYFFKPLIAKVNCKRTFFVFFFNPSIEEHLWKIYELLKKSPPNFVKRTLEL